MADVSFGAAGDPTGLQSGVTSLSVPWPEITLGPGQLALLVVGSRTGAQVGTEFQTPDGWNLIGQSAFTGSSSYRTNVYSRAVVAGDGDADVVVKGSSGSRGSLQNAEGQMFVLDSAVRASSKGASMTVDAGNAGVWVTAGLSSLPSAVDDWVESDMSHQQVSIHPVSSQTYINGYAFSPPIGIEVEKQPGPSAPTLLAPAAGSEVSASADVTFRFAHNGFNPQSAFTVRVRQTGTSTWYYVKADGTLTTTATDISSSQTSISVDSDEFTANTEYEWQARTFDGDQWSPYSASQSFTPSTPPTVTVTGPSSGITDDLTPTVTWSASFSGARSQVAFRVVATNALGTVLADSGTLLGDQASYTTAPLVDASNGGDVTFTVTVTQTGGATGTGSTTQTLSWTPPSSPTVTAVADRVGVLVTVGADVDTTLDVQRSVDGETWTDVAVGLPVRTADDVVLHDVLAPYGVPVTYRVRSLLTLDLMPLGTDWVVSDEVTSTDADFYLVSADDPTTYAAPILVSDTNRQTVRSGSVSYGFGAKTATVDYGPLQGETGECLVTTQTQSEAAAVYALLTSPGALWLRWPPDREDYGVRLDVPATLVAVTPDPVVHDRRYQLDLALRDFPFKWVEQSSTTS